MGLLSYMLGDLRGETWGPGDERWYHHIGAGSMTPAGMRVDPEAAKKISAWYRGRDILATVLAQLPLLVYERLPNDGGAEVARRPSGARHSARQAEPVAGLLPVAAAEDVPLDRSRERLRLDRAGSPRFVDELHPIHPTLRHAEADQPQAPTPGGFSTTSGTRRPDRRRRHTQDEIFHLRGASDDGIVGKGILRVRARRAWAPRSRPRAYAATIFGKGTLNGGVIETPGVPRPRRLEAHGEVLHHGRRGMASAESARAGRQVERERVDARGRADAPQPEVRRSTTWRGGSASRDRCSRTRDPSFGNAEQFSEDFIRFGMGGVAGALGVRR